ncbi:MAG: fimbria major subunit, partial [Rikenellaceae bacterium]
NLFTAWKNAASADVAKYNDAGVFYTGGVNYYRVNIMNDATNADLKYSVLRNKLYDITLKEIRNFGKNTDADLVVPTEPIETNAFINAEITINNWEYKPQESNLE